MDASYYKKKYEPINGKWLIKETLGAGSYGTVFRIEYEDILGKKTEAALKVITIPKSEQEIESVRECLQDDNSLNQYFTNMATKIAEEFDVMAQLKGNTHIVSYEEHDIIPHDNGIGYDILIRMELLKPLNKLFDGITEQEVIKLGIDICRALELCQKYNVVHRDIKPENIFVSPSGDYKLGDFGVAKTMKSELTVMTVAGTYTYMAPELKKGEECGANVDIYSLGMVMYRLLNFNREPFLPLPPEMFTFDQREQALINRMKGMPLPKPVNAGEELAKIILKACEFSPKKRYQYPEQMRLELEALLAKEAKHKKADSTTAADDIASPEMDKNVATNNLTHNQDNTASMFSEEQSKEPDAYGYEGTVGLFSEAVTNPPAGGVFSNPADVSEEEFDGTVGIFSEQNVNLSANLPADEIIKPFSLEEENALPGGGYKVIVHKATSTPISYDITVDGVIYQRNIKEKDTEIKLPAGEHQITIQLQALTDYVSTINPNNIDPDTQNKLKKWIQLYSVSTKVFEQSKITFENHVPLTFKYKAKTKSCFKIVSIQTASGVEVFADSDTPAQKELMVPEENLAMVSGSNNINPDVLQPCETYTVTLKRFYINKLANDFAVDIMVDGKLFACEQKGDYILVLDKGKHQVEIGYSNIHSSLEKTNPSAYKKKIHFVTTGQGELHYGFEPSGVLKAVSAKGFVSNIVVRW